MSKIKRKLESNDKEEEKGKKKEKICVSLICRCKCLVNKTITLFQFVVYCHQSSCTIYIIRMCTILNVYRVHPSY
jgi:hypothetical protein